MKIERITTRSVKMPQTVPLVTGNIRIEAIWFLLVDIDTDQGVRGSSHIWGFNQAGAAAQKAVIEHLSTAVLGEDPCATGRIWAKMWKALIQWGHAGIPVMGLSALDAACWDAVGKIAGQPLANLLGRKLDAVPAYASGLWITDDLDMLQREARDFIEQGFKAMKMRVGRGDVAKDVAAVRAVREAIGPEVDLMADFSSALSRSHAHRLAHALEPYQLAWIEDPIADEDVQDHADIVRAVNTPVCFGEKVYAPQGLQKIIEARAADVLMADMQRAGGVTGWNRIAALADSARLPLSSHILPELNLHLVASAPTGYYLEHLTWAENLFNEPMELSNGAIKVPQRPGFGVSWNEDRIKSTQVDQQVFKL